MILDRLYTFTAYNSVSSGFSFYNTAFIVAACSRDRIRGSWRDVTIFWHRKHPQLHFRSRATEGDTPLPSALLWNKTHISIQLDLSIYSKEKVTHHGVVVEASKLSALVRGRTCHIYMYPLRSDLNLY